MKKLLVASTVMLYASLGAAFAGENALFDANRNPTTIAVDPGGKTKNLHADNNGNLMVDVSSGSISISSGSKVIANQGAPGVSPWPVSAASLPLPAGAATDATLYSLSQKVSTSAAGIMVDGSSVTQPVRDAPLISKSYAYASFISTSAPSSLSLTGIGLSWKAITSGGYADININGGSTIVISTNSSLSSDFKLLTTNPTINITALGTGAVIELFMDGAN